GNITAIAGWDGTTGFGGSAGMNQPATVNFPDFVADSASYGNNAGSIYLGDGSQAAGIAVGSAGGATQVAGHGLELSGSSAVQGYAQLGYAPAAAGPVSGAISARLKEGGLILNAGNANGAFVQ